MPPTAAESADELRRRGLRRMRTVCLGLLVLAAVGYALTIHRGSGWPWLNAAAEAAMVGGLADWFAVSALFRRPLGLPIPHTAIIPTRKEALGRSLEAFVTENFLAPEVVRTKVADAMPSARLGSWLTAGTHSERVVAEAARVVRAGLAAVRDDEVDLVVSAVLPRLAEQPLSPAAGRLLAEVVRDGAHHGLVDLVLDEAVRWLEVNGDRVAAVVGSRAPRWSPRWLDGRVAGRVQREAVELVAAVRAHADHPVRLAIDDLLARFAADLQDDPATRERAEALKRRVLDHVAVPVAIGSLWRAVRTSVVEATADAEGPLRRRGVQALRDLGARLGTDAALQVRLDGYAVEAVGYVAAGWGAEIATVISDTIDRWDGRDAARRIELYVGRDLQFIRVNGTVVGALAGLAIHALTVLA
jgi:uncharacterized membrane-anchored protein YjiN (DUF445 family)